MREPTIDICGIPCEPVQHALPGLYEGVVYLLVKGGGGLKIEARLYDNLIGDDDPLEAEHSIWLSLSISLVPAPLAWDQRHELHALRVVGGATIEEVATRARTAQVVDRAVDAFRLFFPHVELPVARHFSLTHTLTAPPTDSASPHFNGIAPSGAGGDDG